MKLLLVALFSILPLLSFSQGFSVMIGNTAYPTDKVPEHVTLPDKVKKLRIKTDRAEPASGPFIVQIGEEEHSFAGDGAYHDVEFSHDIRGLVVYLMDNKRKVRGKPFILKKRK
ncbi:hypothetical protein [Pontibacter roseus]|uniref:hypothetical protein n=1 Tax=Pontibacter roseus TaxID=336989 RepID=UPI00035F488B|nr:hypothetical protein [Pontibacter roseus]